MYRVFEKELPSSMNKLDVEIIENLHERVHTIKQNNLSM